MPTSDLNNISPILRTAVKHIRPKRVMDLGVGCGKFGALLREYTDFVENRIPKHTWQTFIAGIEGFEAYANPMWQLYDTVLLGDFTTMHVGTFDLVLMIDSLEHVEMEKGKEYLDRLRHHNANIIVSVPDSTHQKWEQGAWAGNELERHLAHWTRSDLEKLGGYIIHSDVCSVAWFRGHK
jgi:hypothetical protein